MSSRSVQIIAVLLSSARKRQIIAVSVSSAQETALLMPIQCGHLSVLVSGPIRDLDAGITLPFYSGAQFSRLPGSATFSDDMVFAY